MRKYALTFVGLLCLALLMSFTFPNKKKKKMAAPPEMQYVPSGVFVELEGERKIETKMSDFFMMEIEVTNGSYKEFLADLDKEGKKDELRVAKVQEGTWMIERPNGETMDIIKTYFEHDAYADYPVVSISKEAAELYCEWLTEKWNNSEDKPKKLQNLKIEYRLPTQKEWMYAAQGGHELVPFPWEGAYMRAKNGQILANFKRVLDTSMKFNHETKEWEVVESGHLINQQMKRNANKTTSLTWLAPSRSYLPNDFGLYNMSGNASEMLQNGGTKGGSWGSSGYYLQIDAEEEFPELNGEASRYVGFRPVAVIKN